MLMLIEKGKRGGMSDRRPPSTEVHKTFYIRLLLYEQDMSLLVRRSGNGMTDRNAG